MQEIGYIYGLYVDDEIKYVGQTTSIYKAWYRHRARANSGWNLAVYTWMRYVGVDNVKLLLIEVVDKAELNNKEKYWIARLPNLKNLTDGGQKGVSIKCPEGCTCQRHKYQTKQTHNCDFCGKEYIYAPSSSMGKYCSLECCYNHWKRPNKICVICNKHFDHPNKDRITCTIECRKIYNRNNQTFVIKCEPGCTCRRHVKRERSAEYREKMSKANLHPPIVKYCKFCNQEMTLIGKKAKRKIFCSRKCALKFWHNAKGHNLH